MERANGACRYVVLPTALYLKAIFSTLSLFFSLIANWDGYEAAPKYMFQI